MGCSVAHNVEHALNISTSMSTSSTIHHYTNTVMRMLAHSSTQSGIAEFSAPKNEPPLGPVRLVWGWAGLGGASEAGVGLGGASVGLVGASVGLVGVSMQCGDSVGLGGDSVGLGGDSVGLGGGSAYCLAIHDMCSYARCFGPT